MTNHNKRTSHHLVIRSFIILVKIMEQIRFHDLRHSCATLMLANNEEMKKIQAWLGHSTISITADTYAHLDMASKVTSAGIISDSLSTLAK